jgi:hypothetical protein
MGTWDMADVCVCVCVCVYVYGFTAQEEKRRIERENAEKFRLVLKEMADKKEITIETRWKVRARVRV